MDFQDVIDLLLQKEATLDADCEAEKLAVCERIDAEYEVRRTMIDKALTDCGYVRPVIEETVEPVAEEVATDNQQFTF